MTNKKLVRDLHEMWALSRLELTAFHNYINSKEYLERVPATYNDVVVSIVNDTFSIYDKFVKDYRFVSADNHLRFLTAEELENIDEDDIPEEV